jgi:hypothetical protein
MKIQEKERRMVKEIIHLQFLKGKHNLFVPFVEILAMFTTHAELEKEQRRNPNKPLRTKPRDGRKTSLKNSILCNCNISKIRSNCQCLQE